MRRIAVIGGGVTGCSVAFHLAERGLGEVHLFERDQLGSGTTWHSAGNITWKPVDDNDSGVLYLLDLIARLEAETDLTSGWRRTGRLFLARDTQVLKSFEAFHRPAVERGFDAPMLSAREAGERHPLLDGSVLQGAWFNPLSGRVNPADLVALFARAARARGALVHEQAPVSGLKVENAKVSGVLSGGESLDFDDVVVCAGLWSQTLVEDHGITLAQGGCEHFYIILDVAPRLGPATPSFISPADLIYGREEVGGVLLGCFDEDALTLETADLPDPFSFSLLNENWDKFAPYFEGAAELFPAFATAPVRSFVNGPEAFTPDGNPFVGPAPGIGGLWLCTGMNSHGVTISGTSGHLIADFLEDVAPKFPPDIYEPGRFAGQADDKAWLKRRLSAAPSAFYRSTNPRAQSTRTGKA